MHTGTGIAEILDALITVNARLMTFVAELARIGFAEISFLTVFPFITPGTVADKSFVGVQAGARVKTRIWATRIHILTMRSTISRRTVT